jgi:hypothetical protein
MKTHTLKFLFCTLLLAFGCSQRTQEEIEIDKAACTQCAYMSASKRMKLYPFSEAAEIQMISWGETLDTINGKLKSQQLSFEQENDTVCYSKCKEIKILDKKQIDQLSFLMYNIGLKDTTAKLPESGCYAPRNAILFLDKRGKILEFIEVCFNCDQMKYSDNVNLGQMCIQKFDILRVLFCQVGILYGTTKRT